ERTLHVQLDPRVDVSDADLVMQRELSKVCYDSYHQLQDIVEAIDSRSNATDELNKLRGRGAVGDPDIMYGSIRQTPIEEETVVGLQHKFLFVLKLFQSADGKISTQAIEGLELLKASLEGVKARWEKFN
ncbi:MAG: hypothetical protein KDD15_17885, partial [Lewinella sp.]|nr:hypothetical protein [Lewinella sp.]